MVVRESLKGFLKLKVNKLLHFNSVSTYAINIDANFAQRITSNSCEYFKYTDTDLDFSSSATGYVLHTIAVVLLFLL